MVSALLTPITAMSTQFHESTLIKGLIDGDRRSFDRIYDLYASRLFAFSLEYCKSKADAEDVVQDVFIKLWLNRARIKNTDSVKSLLFAMSRNALIDSWKSRIAMEYGSYTEANAVGSEDVSEQEYFELETLVNGYIDRLTPTQRDVVRMSRFEHKGHREIAEHLDLSVQTVKNALSQGLRILRQNLGKHIFMVIQFCGLLSQIIGRSDHM